MIADFYLELWQLGVDLSLEGDKVKVEVVSFLTPPLLDKLKASKDALKELLKMDQKAKEAGFLVLENGTTYSRQYSKNGYIFLSREGDKWSAWRETWGKDGGVSMSTSVIISAVGFDLALLKANQRLEYVSKVS
jgi:hypothetical protein